MERVDDEEDNYSTSMVVNNNMGMDYSLDQQQHHLMKPTVRAVGEHLGENNKGTMMVDYMFNQNTPPQPPQHMMTSGFSSSPSLDRLSFAEVMQFADFGPKLALNKQSAASSVSGKNIISDEEVTTEIIDPVYFLKFPVLSDRFQQDDNNQNSLLLAPPLPPPIPTGNDDHHEEENRFNIGDQNNTFFFINDQNTSLERNKDIEDHDHEGEEEEEEARIISENTTTSLNNRLRFLGGDINNHRKMIMNPSSEGAITKNSRRKRPRSVKTSEEVESQRMTHIAVERNRRKQMNEHLRVLRSLMPGSYVQRGDQASIIGGAIEFVRELEQLLQCLESQKRRRLFGGNGDSSSSLAPAAQPPPFFPAPNLPLPNDQMKFVDIEQASGLREETAENKSCLADVEVKLLGMDAMIKILSRRRPGQLLKTIAAFEDLQLNILHTNITTIEQTVLYSFNVKVASETRYTADDIASSVQQIFNFIHASSTI